MANVVEGDKRETERGKNKRVESGWQREKNIDGSVPCELSARDARVCVTRTEARNDTT